MKYEKPPLKFEQQAIQLIKRGLICELEDLVSVLGRINYYRLSGYLYPFRDNSEDLFKKDTTLHKILRVYEFDSNLRTIVLDGIEPIEIYLRTNFAYEFSHTKGAFGYLIRENLPKLNAEKFEKLKNELNKNLRKSKESFILHFKKKYGDVHDFPPIWIIIEIITFGNLVTFYEGSEKSLHELIGKKWDLSDKVFMSWIHTLLTIRNICAHHSRLWNRTLGHKPLIPIKDNHWHSPVMIQNGKIFSILTIIQYIHIKLGNSYIFKNKIESLLSEFSEISISEMGFPLDWKEIEFWK